MMSQGLPPMSKRQQKKLKKQEFWEKKKEIIKQQKKEKKKANGAAATRTCHSHLTRFNHLHKEAPGDDQEEEKKGHLTKKEKQALFKQLCEKGPKIIIDCEFDSLMQERELKSLGQQLAYCHSTNKKMEQPMNIYMTGVGAKLRKFIETQNCQNWAVDIKFSSSTNDSELSIDSEYLKNES